MPSLLTKAKFIVNFSHRTLAPHNQRSNVVSTNTDLYQVLGVPRDATTEEIRDAFRRIVSQTHPDKTGNDQAKTAKFREATRAYETLGNPTKRRLYDRSQQPPNSIQEFFASSPAALRVLEVQLPTAPAAPQRGVQLVAVAKRQKESQVLEVSLERPGFTEALKIQLQLPNNDFRWCRLANLGGLGRNGEENGELWIFVRD